MSNPPRLNRATLAVAACALLAIPLVAFAPTEAAPLPAPLSIEEYTIAPDAMCALREKWVNHLLEKYPEGTWAPMRTSLDDEDLALMRLPPTEYLRTHRFEQPTMVSPDGTTEVVDLGPLMARMGTAGPSVAAYGGTGCLGIRPGAWLLLLGPDGIPVPGGSVTGVSYVNWCSMAHVYGAPGSYQVSTAGHCGKTGDIATAIVGFGNRNGALNPILLDFGKFSKSTGDAGIGKDWALISVDPAWQGLVSPTMCFWGGPVGMYTKTGATVSATLLGRQLVQGPYLNPDPLLAQGIVHYGHGAGVGTAGTPRAGTTFYWTTGAFIWEGAIAPGDSGSGSNTLTGDTLGAEREAAGINTHIFVDPSLKTGIGYLAGTRATLVTATLANGQLVPYPAPVPGAP